MDVTKGGSAHAVSLFLQPATAGTVWHMILALLSDQSAEHVDPELRVIELLGRPRPRIAYVPSASDSTREYYNRARLHYKMLGADLAVYCDLGDEFDERVVATALRCDAIHLSGGRTACFLATIIARGFSSQLREYARGGGAIIGVSAGGIVLTPSIVTASDSQGPQGVDPENRSGLGLVPFLFVPHLPTDVSRRTQLSNIAAAHPEYLVLGCSDGEGIVVRDTAIEMFGDIVVGGNLGSMRPDWT